MWHAALSQKLINVSPTPTPVNVWTQLRMVLDQADRLWCTKRPVRTPYEYVNEPMVLCIAKMLCPTQPASQSSKAPKNCFGETRALLHWSVAFAGVIPFRAQSENSEAHCCSWWASHGGHPMVDMPRGKKRRQAPEHPCH